MYFNNVARDYLVKSPPEGLELLLHTLIDKPFGVQLDILMPIIQVDLNFSASRFKFVLDYLPEHLGLRLESELQIIQRVLSLQYKLEAFAEIRLYFC